MSDESQLFLKEVILGEYAYIKARIGWRGLSSTEYIKKGGALLGAGNHIENGRFNWTRCDRISIERYEESPEIALQEKDVVISKDGTIGRVAYIEKLPSIATINGTMMLIRSKRKELEPLFLYHYLLGEKFQSLIREKVSGSSVPHIFQRDMVGLKMNIPPLPEQKKIANIISCVTEVIENNQKQLDKLQYLKQSTLNELLTRGIGHQDFKVSELGMIPKSWQIKRFRDVCGVANGQVDPKKEPYSNMKHIGLVNIEKYTGRLLDVKTAAHDGQTSGKYLFQETDILYGKINPHFAKIAFPRYSGICSADIYPIYCDDDLKPTFLFYYLLSNEFTKYAVSVSGRTGMPKINREDLNLAKIRIPPIDEQIKIASILNSMDKLIKRHQIKIRKLCSLKQSISQDLLAGKVRVKVN